MLLAQQILNGLLDGVYYLLIALGLSLIFSLGGIVNLAHGAFYAIGAYLTLVLSPYLGFGGVVRRGAGRGGAARRGDRAHAVPPLLSLRPDPLAADDVRPRHGGRAGAADDLWRAAAVLFDSAMAARPGRRSAVSSIRSIAWCCSASPSTCIAGAVAAAAKNLVRPRGARRRAKPRHGRRARHFAAALYVGRRGARHRPCGPRRRAAGADLFDPSGDGPGDHHAGLCRGGDRRPRIVLGRGRRRRCWSASSRASWSASAIPRLPPRRSIC